MKGASDSKPDGDAGALVTWVTPVRTPRVGVVAGVSLCK